LEETLEGFYFIAEELASGAVGSIRFLGFMGLSEVQVLR